MSLLNEKTDWQKYLNIGQLVTLFIGIILFGATANNNNDEEESTLHGISKIILGILAVITVLYTIFLIKSVNEISGVVDGLSIITGLVLMFIGGVNLL